MDEICWCLMGRIWEKGRKSHAYESEGLKAAGRNWMENIMNTQSNTEIDWFLVHWLFIDILYTESNRLISCTLIIYRYLEHAVKYIDFLYTDYL